MASGRLGRCILGNRSGAEVYHNQSGKEVSVTIFSQALSTTLNSELTTVVGVAATVLGSTVIVANSGQTGTYQSTTAINYSCAFCRCDTASSEYPAPSIASTIQGAYRTWRCCCALAGDYGGAYPTMGPAFISTEGNITDVSRCTTGYSCQCSNCCVPIVYGGNEIQSPSVWIDAQEPRVCWDSTHGPMYQSNVVGWFPLAYCSGGMCCRRCCWPQAAGSFITQRQIGTGVTAAQRAAQFMANPMCQCAQNDTWFMPNGGTNNTFPLQNYQGCDSNNGCRCRGGSHCNIQGCRLCYYGDYEGRQTYTLFNYYALCNTPAWTGRSFSQGVRCCLTNSNCDDWNTCFDCGAGACGWPGLNEQGPYKIPCGKYGSPMWWMIAWCGDSPHTCCDHGFIVQGNGYRVRTHCNEPCCGCVCWHRNADKCLRHNGCHTVASRVFHAVCHWTCKIQCECRPRNCPNNSKRMSPYGYMFGMTNCFAMMYSENSTATCQDYYFGFNDICLWNCCWCQFCPCLFTTGFRFHIPDENLSPQNDEFTVKYVAFNPHDCYVYTAIRSSSTLDCGIWRIDPHEIRRQAGLFCGCSSANCHCCGGVCGMYSMAPSDPNWAVALAHDGGGGACALCRSSVWPAVWDCEHYTRGGFCVSCLYRSGKCLWTMGVYNHQTKKWDGFSTKNLWQWDASGDPLVQKVNDTLTRSITDDYRCVVEVCNCFFANMDCSGLIDYKVSANQYERTGIVLSNGDRVMVNNNSDHKTNVQVWGFEG